MAATVETFLTAGTSTWTCPTGVTSVQVECYGGGGTGAGFPTHLTAGVRGGGAGGQYVKQTVPVTPGVGYELSIAAARTATTGDAANGFNTTFANPTGAPQRTIAIGGASAVGTTGGAGSTTGGVGDVINAGGNGANTITGYSGAGGGGGGTTGVGGNGGNSTTVGGTSGGGLAGTGGPAKRSLIPDNSGAAGVQAGGGGGGAATDATYNGGVLGGNGTAGAIVLTYTIVLTTSKHHFILSGE